MVLPGRGAARKSKTKSVPFQRVCIGKGRKKESKSARYWGSFDARAHTLALAEAQHETDLEAIFDRGFTEELAKELAEILGCEWDLVFRYAAKYGDKMRDPSAAKAAALAYVEKHGKPGAPYKDSKPIFLTEKQEEAEEKSILFQRVCAERKRRREDDDKAKKQRAKDRAKAAKGKKGKTQETLRSIIAKKKAAEKKPPAKKKAATKPPSKSGAKANVVWWIGDDCQLFPREEGITLDQMLLTTCKPVPGCIVTVINKSNSERVVKIQFEKAYEQSVVVTPPGENPRRVNFTHVEGKLLDVFWKEDASGGELLLSKRARVRCYAEHVESVQIH